MPDQHALLSASGARRWLNCPPSAVLESREQDTSSAAAEQGTVADAAEAAGYADIYDTRLITLTAMERLMGKKTFNEVLGDIVVKPMGKPTLVPDTDKRPALDIHSAQTEFTKTESR